MPDRDEMRALRQTVDQIADMLERGPKLAYSIDEAVWTTALSRSVLYEDIAAGTLVIRKRGTRTIILTEDLGAYLAALPKPRVSR